MEMTTSGFGAWSLAFKPPENDLRRASLISKPINNLPDFAFLYHLVRARHKPVEEADFMLLMLTPLCLSSWCPVSLLWLNGDTAILGSIWCRQQSQGFEWIPRIADIRKSYTGLSLTNGIEEPALEILTRDSSRTLTNAENANKAHHQLQPIFLRLHCRSL